MDKFAHPERPSVSENARQHGAEQRLVRTERFAQDLDLRTISKPSSEQMLHFGPFGQKAHLFAKPRSDFASEAVAYCRRKNLFHCNRAALSCRTKPTHRDGRFRFRARRTASTLGLRPTF